MNGTMPELGLDRAAAAEPLVLAPTVAEFLMDMRVSFRRRCDPTPSSRMLHRLVLLGGPLVSQWRATVQSDGSVTGQSAILGSCRTVHTWDEP